MWYRKGTLWKFSKETRETRKHPKKDGRGHISLLKNESVKLVGNSYATQ